MFLPRDQSPVPLESCESSLRQFAACEGLPPVFLEAMDHLTGDQKPQEDPFAFWDLLSAEPDSEVLA